LGGRKTPGGSWWAAREVGGRAGGKPRDVAGEERGGDEAGDEGRESWEVRPLFRLPGNSIGLNMFPSIRSEPRKCNLLRDRKIHQNFRKGSFGSRDNILKDRQSS
jgi:hypothetical protein